MRDLGSLAAEILALAGLYAPAEWAAVEALADMLVQDAQLVRVDPREHAAERMRLIETATSEDPDFDDDNSLARADIAMAAALVYVGRVS